MPLPSENPVTTQEEFGHHLRYDGIGGNTAAGTSVSTYFHENFFGHRSGVGNATPWSTPPTRPQPGFYQDANSQGAGTVTYTATTLVDTSKTWQVGDQNSGGTVTYAATTITDTARNNASSWVVGNTAQYAGIIVRTATGKLGIIASVAAGVATLTAAGWSGGTPAAGEQYTFMPMGWVGRTVFAVGTGGALSKLLVTNNIVATVTGAAWTNGTPSAGAAYILGPDLTPGVLNSADLDGFGRAKLADNWQFTLRGLFNPNNL